ncbi:hypothetical protein X943_000565 [Babesia divergens]|uniref:Protein transport protein Sec61 subunit beta n=1 Tax=Babesia divergens TaxID=32595 RepID=A0AAD9LHS3_BABDI|nr:hypothetical protein X943_000565 [Babesia divergens]
MPLINNFSVRQASPAVNYDRRPADGCKRAQSETNTSGTRTNLPPNSGFQRYYGFATSSIQMGPQAVLLLAICYMGAVVIMHIVSRIKTSI